MDIYEPIILDPVGLTPGHGWKECHDYVEQCGGVTHSDGEVNWRAAFGADPGISSCPACKAKHWAWGNKIQCSQCGFAFPTDWWPMYSYGVNAGRRVNTAVAEELHGFLNRLHHDRLSHPYYRYGFEHPVDDAWAERDRIDWKTVLNG